MPDIALEIADILDYLRAQGWVVLAGRDAEQIVIGLPRAPGHLAWGSCLLIQQGYMQGYRRALMQGMTWMARHAPRLISSRRWLALANGDVASTPPAGYCYDEENDA